MRSCASGIERFGGLTLVKIRDRFQDMAIGVEGLFPTDSTGWVPVRVQDDLGVDEMPGRDSLIQSLAKGRGSRHVCGVFE